nr:MAG TPA: hypothetical protein [Caudoviricetes sp.]
MDSQISGKVLESSIIFSLLCIWLFLSTVFFLRHFTVDDAKLDNF